MNKIKRQVSKARRRLMLGRFMRVLCWSIFGGLLCSAIGLAIPKIVHIPFVATPENEGVWIWSWVVAGAVIGFVLAALLTWRRLETQLATAVEVDRRFGLKERLSSAMSMTSQDAESESGQALVKDAIDRAELIDIRDKFTFQPTWRALMPLIPLVLLVGLLFVPNRPMTVQDDKAALAQKVDREKVKTRMKEIKKKLADKKNKQFSGLEDAKLKIENMERHFDELANAKTEKDKKQALAKLNDIKKQIADKRKTMGDKNKLKESLNKLKDVNEGPAKQLAEALADGDMKEAQKAIKNLADKLKSGKLSETEKKKLAKDMKQMAEQLQKMADKHKKAKEDLKEKIKQAQRDGDIDKAQELQEKLEKMQNQDKQMDKMEKMSKKMQDCSDCMKQGNGQPKMGKDGKPKAGQKPGNQPSQKQMDDMQQALEDLAEDMESMQQALEDMEDLEDLEDAIDQAKNAGNGLEGDDPGKPGWNDFAKGSGKGHGERDREKGESGGYKTGVKGLIQKGETVVTGHADGNNISGKSLTEARSMVQESMGKDSDPLENVKLPKSKREQARQYFDKRRKGG